MAEIKAAKTTNNREIPLPVRAFSIAVPLTIVSCVFLGVTGYPVEEWPFAAGVFVASLLLSGSFVIWVLQFVGKKLNDYGHVVLVELGVDVAAAVAEVAVPRAFWITVSLVLIFLLLGAVWGLALNVLVLVVERVSMPPFGAALPLVANVMFLVGVCGLSIGLLLQLVLIYSVRRIERQRILVSDVARFVINVARAGDRFALFWRTVGFSVRSGTG